MSAIVILLIAAVCFIAAYITYGSWLAKQWGVEMTALHLLMSWKTAWITFPLQPLCC